MKKRQKLMKENIKMMAGIGYLGMGHEEAYGGTNLDLISQAIAGEEVASACASTFLSCGASSGLFGMPSQALRHRKSRRKNIFRGSSRVKSSAVSVLPNLKPALMRLPSRQRLSNRETSGFSTGPKHLSPTRR